MVTRTSTQKMAPWFMAVAIGVIVFGISIAHAGEASRGVEPIQVKGEFGTWVTALPDGRLMTWWSKDKPGATDSTGSVQLAFARFSPDNGATWTKPQLLFEFPRAKGKGRYEGKAIGGILCDRQGGIHIFGRFWSSWNWEKFKGDAFVFHVMSDDNCKTWSKVQTIPTGYSYSGIHQPLVLKSGRIVLPVWHAFDDKRDWGCMCAFSDDRGKTWQMTGEMGPGLKDEQSGVELKDGRILMLFRKYDGGRLLETFSTDGGQTWKGIRESRFVAPASPPALLRLKDGRIILIWNNSQKPKHVFNRLVLTAAISDDEGKTWRGYREIARTSGVPGPKGWVCYPFITQTRDGTVIVTYGTAGFKANLLRVDPEWLMQTEFREDFSKGLDNWITMRTEGVTPAPHPTAKDRKVLQMRKPNPEMASGASLNFPFGERGKLTIRLRLEPGFGGARISLTDHFTWPHYAEKGRFGIRIWANGKIVEAVGAGEIAPLGVTLEPGKWHTLEFDWDCKKSKCALTVDSRYIADLSQLSDAVGVCYLRLWSAAEKTDQAGLLVDSVTVSAQP